MRVSVLLAVLCAVLLSCSLASASQYHHQSVAEFLHPEGAVDEQSAVPTPSLLEVGAIASSEQQFDSVDDVNMLESQSHAQASTHAEAEADAEAEPNMGTLPYDDVFGDGTVPTRGVRQQQQHAQQHTQRTLHRSIRHAARHTPAAAHQQQQQHRFQQRHAAKHHSRQQPLVPQPQVVVQQPLPVAAPVVVQQQTPQVVAQAPVVQQTPDMVAAVAAAAQAQAAAVAAAAAAPVAQAVVAPGVVAPVVAAATLGAAVSPSAFGNLGAQPVQLPAVVPAPVVAPVNPFAQLPVATAPVVSAAPVVAPAVVTSSAPKPPMRTKAGRLIVPTEPLSPVLTCIVTQCTMWYLKCLSSQNCNLLFQCLQSDSEMHECQKLHTGLDATNKETYAHLNECEKEHKCFEQLDASVVPLGGLALGAPVTPPIVVVPAPVVPVVSSAPVVPVVPVPVTPAPVAAPVVPAPVVPAPVVAAPAAPVVVAAPTPAPVAPRVLLESQATVTQPAATTVHHYGAVAPSAPLVQSHQLSKAQVNEEMVFDLEHN